MLGFLPEIYPDELLYSLMARYANRSGYLLYRAVAEELFFKPKELPNILFLNRYKDNVQNRLTKNKSMDSLIQHYTMFNNYGLFLPVERKKEAYDSLLDGDSDYHQKLQMSKSGKDKTLKFCPVCAQHDLQNYSETYWHRSWQIEDIEISPVPVSYEQTKGEIKGYYVPKEHRIVVGCGMSELQTIKTLVHEITHALLHNPDAIKERKTDRDTQEIEAESTAFIVSSLLGLDTSEYSFEYIANWAGKDNLKAVNSAMKNIQDTANQLYDEIQQNLQQNKK